MNNIQLQNPTQDAAGCTIDVLFVTNQERTPDALLTLLVDKNLEWVEVSYDKFYRSIKEWSFIGTVLLDTVNIEDSQKSKLTQTIKKLEEQNIASILLNNTIGLSVNEFKLITSICDDSMDQLWGIIQSNIRYRTVSTSSCMKTQEEPFPLSGSIPDDTQEQLKMAGQVQRNFLPSSLPDNEHLKWSVIFEPADWVSGDIYDATRLDEQHVGFYIADAVGHSMPAALLTMFLKQAIMMRETKGRSYRIFTPIDVLKNLNNRMVEQNLSGCLFTTCCYCLLNLRTMQLTYCRAGHPYPILIKKDQQPQLLESRGSLIGVFKDAEFEQHSIQLEPGDKLLIYSDGAERLFGRNVEDEKFVYTPKFLSSIRQPLDEVTEQLNQIQQTTPAKREETDDVTVVGLEIL